MVSRIMETGEVTFEFSHSTVRYHCYKAKGRHGDKEITIYIEHNINRDCLPVPAFDGIITVNKITDDPSKSPINKQLDLLAEIRDLLVEQQKNDSRHSSNKRRL